MFKVYNSIFCVNKHECLRFSICLCLDCSGLCEVIVSLYFVDLRFIIICDVAQSIMAPSKKTKSAPNTTTINLMKALKRNHSGETSGTSKKALKRSKSVQASPQSSSPQSEKKKAISTNLQRQLSNKRKKMEEPVPAEEGGVKRLKRGPVTMHRIVRRKMMGIKLTVSFNTKGEPYGKVVTKMQSYIGVLARTKAPIWYEIWKRVPKEKKNKIWDCVLVKLVASLYLPNVSNCY